MILNVEIFRYPKKGYSGKIDGHLIKWNFETEYCNVFNFYENLWRYEDVLLNINDKRWKNFCVHKTDYDIRWRVWVEE